MTFPPRPRPVYETPTYWAPRSSIGKEPSASRPTFPEEADQNGSRRLFWIFADSYFSNPEIERLHQQVGQEEHDSDWWGARRKELVTLTRANDYSFQLKDIGANCPFIPSLGQGPEGQGINLKNRELFLRKIKPFLDEKTYEEIQKKILTNTAIHRQGEWIAMTNRVIQDKKL